MTNNLKIVIAREYTSRVRRKSFIISTILMPLLFIGLMALPGIVANMTGPEDKTVAVVDNSGLLAPAFTNTDNMTFIMSDKDTDQLKKDEDIDAILVIPADIVTNPDGATLFTRSSTSLQSDMFLSSLISKAIEQIKLKEYNIDNLEQIIAAVHTDVNIKTIRIDGEEEQESSSVASYIVGVVMSMILYMFIMLYGQMVMTSIIEEKSNRVLELVVSSVKPTQLMLGKIIGIGCVAVTQLLIWAVLIGGFTALVMPELISGIAGDAELSQIITTLGDPVYIMGLFGVMALFLVFGYLFYSGIYTAIGSAVDNIQDASQLQSFALVPIILAMVFAMTVLNDPNSSLAVTLSMIPFTSPVVMMARIPFGIPVMQIIISLAILVVSMYFVIWLSAKIYRVGIFMYGKKPTAKDLIRWARYK